ncbi:MAG: hypothetical protein IKQ77_01505, partial [Prevotella sp.]|nr:hypothetical protein [Prevotella sp.]
LGRVQASLALLSLLQISFADFCRDSAEFKQAWLCSRCSKLASLIFVATRQSSSKLGSALAAPN